MISNQDRIDSYLQGRLTSLECVEFEHALELDQALKNDFKLTKAISKSLKDRVSVYAHMDKWEKEITQEKHQTGISLNVRTIFYIGSSIAACLILVLFALRPFYNLGSNKSHDTYALNIPHFDTNDYLSNDYHIYTNRIDSLLNIKEYEEAITYIALVESDFNVICINDNRLEKAGITETEFSSITKYLNDRYMLKWRKINALLALNRQSEALNILENYKDEKGKYKEDARHLFNVLTSE